MAISLLMVLILSGCTSNKQNQTKNPFSAMELKYSAYIVNEIADTFKFYLAHYIEIDSNGNYVLMRHKANEIKPIYFSGHLPDSTRKQIDTILQNKTYKSHYTWDENSNFLYCGYTYTIDYKNINSARKTIQFIPNNSPLPIRILGEILDSIIYKTHSNKLDTLFLDDYAAELKKNYNYQTLPKKYPTIQFTPPH